MCERKRQVTPSMDETAGLDLFDETATAAGNFPHALRGYDRAAVDAYVRDVEVQLAKVKSQLRDTRRRLTAANQRVDDTDYTKLGTHTKDLLRAAEAQAVELVKGAQEQADRIRAEAQSSAGKLTTEARLALDASQASNLADIDGLRQRLSAQTASELAAAGVEAAALRTAAERDRAQILTEAQAQSEAIVAAAAAEAARQLAEAERLAAVQITEAATSKAEELAAVAQARRDATEAIEALIEGARQQSEEYRARLEADAVTWEQRRQAALTEAAEITLGAQQESRALVEAARNTASSIVTQAHQESESRRVQLSQDIDRLTVRKQAIIGQLESLSSLATESVKDFPDEIAAASTTETSTS